MTASILPSYFFSLARQAGLGKWSLLLTRLDRPPVEKMFRSASLSRPCVQLRPFFVEGLVVTRSWFKRSNSSASAVLLPPSPHRTWAMNRLAFAATAPSVAALSFSSIAPEKPDLYFFIIASCEAADIASSGHAVRMASSALFERGRELWSRSRCTSRALRRCWRIPWEAVPAASGYPIGLASPVVAGSCVDVNNRMAEVRMMRMA